ncbi:MAG: 4-hydroxy-tetrahydrodipicolinate reductase [Lactimicrobium sp.]|jgi:4-hydroxy-tetrahydrodipicolinate reductase|uniref:4-hydroxy-tetrahydrodipicolinate reductase n=1 Tax=Lactimicrobium sp. TaxID=2563780 RepID=UPI002F35D8FC
MRIIVSGANGRMGKILQDQIQQETEQLAAAVSRSCLDNPETHCYSSFAKVSEKVDVVIDFSHHSTVSDLLHWCIAHNVPAVIATTGHTPQEKEMIASAAKQIPIFFTGNTSVGIALLANMVKDAVKMFPDADVEIVEVHHHDKQDVPSGTALMLADAVKEVRPDAWYNIGRHENGKRDPHEIGIHSLRIGNETGTHEVHIRNGEEELVLCHHAYDRSLFAKGALQAARFLVRQKAGLYTMKEMLAG